jgi:uncharacterized tellurite resistance protein B-like protein
MPIAAVVLLTLLFWVAYWFIRMGGLEHLRAKAAQRKEDTRLAKVRESERSAVLRAVDDPRDAAAILMLLLARAGGDPTREQIAAIESILRTSFGFEQELTERMVQARFMATRAESFEQGAAIFSDLLTSSLTIAERQQLVGMLEEVARLDGPSPRHSDAIVTLRHRMELMPVR